MSASKIPNANIDCLIEGQDDGIRRNTCMAENKLGEYFYIKAKRNLATNYDMVSNGSLPLREHMFMSSFSGAWECYRIWKRLLRYV